MYTRKKCIKFLLKISVPNIFRSDKYSLTSICSQDKGRNASNVSGIGIRF
jgi:hypothetical protein